MTVFYVPVQAASVNQPSSLILNQLLNFHRRQADIVSVHILQVFAADSPADLIENASRALLFFYILAVIFGVPYGRLLIEADAGIIFLMLFVEKYDDKRNVSFRMFFRAEKAVRERAYIYRPGMFNDFCAALALSTNSAISGLYISTPSLFSRCGRR